MLRVVVMMTEADTEDEIVITDQDIDEVESHFKKYFNCSFSDESARETLKCSTSRDIQAGPGGLPPENRTTFNARLL